ncbi:MAG TPA: hypothetical protein VF997_08500 [Polyangia bacterium]
MASGSAVVIAALVALAVVLRGAYRFPFSDDWDLVVPLLDGERALDLSWLWAQHNEHRIPIPKLVLVATDAVVGGGDFRGGVVASWAMLCALCALALGAARRHASDAPAWAGLLLAALVLAPSNNALRWGVESQFVTSALLMTVATAAPPPRWRRCFCR